jgi:hypothetical protein
MKRVLGADAQIRLATSAISGGLHETSPEKRTASVSK